jgi:hypothetical protein
MQITAQQVRVMRPDVPGVRLRVSVEDNGHSIIDRVWAEQVELDFPDDVVLDDSGVGRVWLLIVLVPTYFWLWCLVAAEVFAGVAFRARAARRLRPRRDVAEHPHGGPAATIP